MTNLHKNRLLIADDHKLIGEACRRLLEPEFQVVGVVTDGRALIQAVRELRPAVVILDLYMPQLNGLDAGEKIKQDNRLTKLVYLTMEPAPEIAMEAFRRGASGYVLKNWPAEELITAVRYAIRGQFYLSPLITQDTIQFLLRAKALPSSEKNKITIRQREILQLHAEGKTMKEIGYILGLQPGTVAFHKHRMMHALNIDTNAGLIEYAINHHMVAEYSSGLRIREGVRMPDGEGAVAEVARLSEGPSSSVRRSPSCGSDGGNSPALIAFGAI